VIPVAYRGRGTILEVSLDQAVWRPVAQLQQFEPTGSKQSIADQTNLSSPGDFTQHMPLQVDAGSLSLAGILNPTDTSYTVLAEIHAGLLTAFFRATLIDGSCFNFEASVSDFKPFSAKWNKLYVWSATLKITGGLQGPSGAFQQDGFDSAAYQDF